ncbi:hypothetical protein KSP40_PGU008875 [Platanthera guangdongensis]|uniref:Uncharacterized protein n=1 Tax=Platanthera guangdongensis TaxID=2320717 RepID=A0ABR2N418_9ASPA
MTLRRRCTIFYPSLKPTGCFLRINLEKISPDRAQLSPKLGSKCCYDLPMEEGEEEDLNRGLRAGVVPPRHFRPPSFGSSATSTPTPL